MLRITKTTRRTLCMTLALATLVAAGCNPVSENKTASNKKSTGATTEHEASSSEKRVTASEAGYQRVVIDGELDAVNWRALVGQTVKVTGDLVIIDTFDLARRGQIKVARDRLYVPTSTIDPNDKDPSGTSFEGGNNVAKVVKAQKFNDKATITIDDGPADQNVFPPRLFPGLGTTLPTVRTGSVINGVTGKLVTAGRNLLLIPNAPLKWTPAQRPPRPDVGKADATVSSFNVLNYFTTIDDGRNDARGADSDAEFKRQEEKIIAAILELKADVIGLMEIENNLEAENQLVAALNKEVGEEVFQGCGLPDSFRDAPGGRDAIRVGIIYRSDRVEPLKDVSLILDEAFSNARTPVVQSFKSKTSDKPFTVIVNHFKSKGGSNRADATNKDKGDGQAAFNAARRAQALAICNHIDGLKNGGTEPRVLVIGDLNAYAQEDPIDALRAKGLVDLHERFAEEASSDDAEGQYSFVYRGQSGSLDHALATDALAEDVTGIATWHINADEPKFMDYNEEYNPKSLYEANPFRSSDHDPVLIGIGK